MLRPSQPQRSESPSGVVVVVRSADRDPTVERWEQNEAMDRHDPIVVDVY